MSPQKNLMPAIIARATRVIIPSVKVQATIEPKAFEIDSPGVSIRCAMLFCLFEHLLDDVFTVYDVVGVALVVE